MDQASPETRALHCATPRGFSENSSIRPRGLALPSTKNFVGGAVGVVLVLAVAFFLLGGSGDEAGTPSADAGETSTTHDCQTGGFEQAEGEWGGVACETASGAASFTDTFTCQAPDQSAVGGTLQNATAGTLDMTVEDASGTAVFDDTFQAGAHPVSEFVGQGEAGEWTISVSLSEDWSSEDFGVGAGCQSQSGSGGSGDDGGSGDGSQDCQTNSDIQNGPLSMAQIRCTDQQGEGTSEATFQCENPSQGNVQWDPDMDAGNVTVTILDADAKTTVEETFNGTDRGGASLGSGATGEWTMRTERGTDFQGSFYVQATCQAE